MAPAGATARPRSSTSRRHRPDPAPLALRRPRRRVPRGSARARPRRLHRRRGHRVRDRRGELSLRVDAWQLLAKSLRPPPDKFHGLEDTETRYRRRELDLIANDEVRELFVSAARAIAEIRRCLDDDGFLEVETPVLQPLYGGALARPFTTHHNALDRDLYLRIATELYLKR